MPQEEYTEILLRVKDVQRLTSLSRSSIVRYRAAGHFPSPVKLSANGRIAFKRSEIEAWAEDPLGWDQDRFDDQDEFYAAK